MINTYNFTVDFKNNIFRSLNDNIIFVSKDNNSSFLTFFLAESLEVGYSLLVRLKNSKLYKAKEFIVDVNDLIGSCVVTADVLAEAGTLTMSLSLYKDDVLLTNTEFPNMQIRGSLPVGELSPVELSITLQLLDRVTALEIELNENHYDKTEVNGIVNTHNTSSTAHNDMRVLLAGKTGFKGEWARQSGYNINDLVTYSGILFICLQSYSYSVGQVTARTPVLNTVNPSAWWKPFNIATAIEAQPIGSDSPLDVLAFFKLGTIGNNDVGYLRKTTLYKRVEGLYDNRGLLAANNDMIIGFNTVLNTAEAEAQNKVDTHNADTEAHKELFNLKANKENWRLIRADTITNPITSMLFNTDSEGNPFKIKDILIIQSNWQTATASTANGGVNVNNTTNRVFYNQMGSVSGAANLVRNIHIERLGNYYKGSAWYGTPNSTSVGTLQAMPTMLYLADEAVTSIYMSFASAIATGSFEIWGLDA